MDGATASIHCYINSIKRVMISHLNNFLTDITVRSKFMNGIFSIFIQFFNWKISTLTTIH